MHLWSMPPCSLQIEAPGVLSVHQLYLSDSNAYDSNVLVDSPSSTLASQVLNLLFFDDLVLHSTSATHFRNYTLELITSCKD